MSERHGQHPRRSLRLPAYDYAQAGAYFVTVCTHGRQCLFGDVADGAMVLNDVGKVAQEAWENIPTHFPHVETDAWTVMPNHVHGVIVIARPNVEVPPIGGATHASPLHHRSGPPKHSIGAIVGAYESAVSNRLNATRGTPGARVWQRNYYEHVIRNEADLHRIRQYIADNPGRWAEDPENPAQCTAPTVDRGASRNPHGVGAPTRHARQS